MMKVVKVNAAGLRVRESRQTKLESIRERETKSNRVTESQRVRESATRSLLYIKDSSSNINRAKSMRFHYPIKHGIQYALHTLTYSPVFAQKKQQKKIYNTVMKTIITLWNNFCEQNFQ